MSESGLEEMTSKMNATQMNNLSNIDEQRSKEVENWRENENTIRKKWEYALDHGLYSDVVFHIGKKREPIPCHSILLKLQSRIFAEKADGDFKTELAWIEPKPFRLFLKYLYTETITFEADDDVVAILTVARMFDIQKLVKICTDRVKKDIVVNNAAMFYQRAHDFDHDELETFAKEFVLSNAAHVFETPGFLELTRDSIQALLESPGREIHEVEAFQAVLRWASAENQREHGDSKDTDGLQMILQPIIHNINFSLFSYKEFAQYVVKARVLANDKSLEILTELALEDGPGSGSVLPRKSGNGQKNRMPLNIPPETITLSRYKGTVDGFWREEKGTDKISFKTDKKIGIHGLGLFGACAAGDEGDRDSKVEASITTFDEKNCFGTTVIETILPKPSGTFDIHFEQPVVVEPNVWCTIAVTMEGQVKPFGAGGSKMYEIQLGDQSIKWEFKNAKGISGFSLGRGQIPKIYFTL